MVFGMISVIKKNTGRWQLELEFIVELYTTQHCKITRYNCITITTRTNWKPHLTLSQCHDWQRTSADLQWWCPWPLHPSLVLQCLNVLYCKYILEIGVKSASHPQQFAGSMPYMSTHCPLYQVVNDRVLVPM